MIALLAALAGTVGYGVGSILQALGARRARGPAVVAQPLYLAGLGCDGAAWVCSLLALRGLPLFAVQSLLAGSLAVTVVLARIFLGAVLRVRDGVAVAVVALSLAIVAVAAGAESAAAPPDGFRAAMLTALAVTAVLSLVAYLARRPFPLALLAGIAFSGAALGARGIEADDVRRLVADPAAWTILGFGLLGVLCYARALEAGAVGPVTAVLWVVEVVVPGLLGVLLLGDQLRPGWELPGAIAVAAAIIGCVVLATSPAQPDS